MLAEDVRPEESVRRNRVDKLHAERFAHASPLARPEGSTVASDRKGYRIPSPIAVEGMDGRMMSRRSLYAEA